MGKLLHGDFGTSIINSQPIIDEFLIRFPATIELDRRRDALRRRARHPARPVRRPPRAGLGRRLVTVISLLGISIPVFVLGLTLQYIFAVQLGSAAGAGPHRPTPADLEYQTNFVLIDTLLAGGPRPAFVDGAPHLILPAIALGSIPLAIITRITRASVLDVANEDYVRTARAKGLSERRVDGRHVMRNAWLPVVTVIGLQVGGLLAGAVITETVFAWNGVGRWIVEAIQDRDYFVVQSTILIFALIFLIVNLVVDVVYAFLNPRIRYA